MDAFFCPLKDSTRVTFFVEVSSCTMKKKRSIERKFMLKLCHWANHLSCGKKETAYSCRLVCWID
jgi:hypothetical protein